MRFFRRGESEPQGDFWIWWAGARDRVATAIETGGFDKKLIDEVSKAVRSIDPRLAWEFSAGRRSQHALTVSPEGNAVTRPAAIAWLASAPPPDAKWEYYASRRRAESLPVLEIAGERLDLSDIRAIASWNDQRRSMDVRLWHPVFGRTAPELGQQVSFLFLDNLLGEDDVERWIGRIDVLDAPITGRTPEELRAEVARRAAEPAGDTWVLAQRTGPRGEVDIVMANAALKRIDYPFADQHVAIKVPIDGGGMPNDEQAAQLNAEEDRLVGLLDGVATLAGRTTAPGQRVIHFVAGDLDRVRAGIDLWAQDLPPWRLKVDFNLDPTWDFQRDLGLR